MPGHQLSVLQVLPELVAGGVERGTIEVGNELARRGHRSVVLSGGGRLVEQLERGGSTHIHCPVGKKSPLTLACIPKVRRLIGDGSFDIVHARSRIPAWVTWLAWKSLPESRRPRFVTSFHGLYSPSRFSRIMTQGEAVIAVSKTVRDYIRQHYPDTPESRIRLIYRGVDPGEFPYRYCPDSLWTQRFFWEFPQAKGRQLLTLAGRIGRSKGHQDLLDVLERLLADGLPVHALIVGEPPARRPQFAQELRKQVDRRGLSDHVTFTGHRADVREMYAISHVVLALSTKPESFGRTVPEARHMGVPVVGYAHGGVGETLQELCPQGAVSLGDVDGVAASVRRFLNSNDIDKPLRLPEVTRFELSAMLNQTLQLYAELAGCSTITRRAA